MNRYNIIQSLIDKYQYNSYLEIGVEGRVCFDAIKCNTKIGVDPAIPTGNGIHCATSDDFFASASCKFNCDIIFVDGLHLKDQALRDIKNSLDVLNPEGVIVVHDCLPRSEMEQIGLVQYGVPWMGDVWKAFAELRMTRNYLSMAVVDTDCGCGIIRFGTQQLYPMTENLDWNFYSQHRNELLNVISVEQFKELYL